MASCTFVNTVSGDGMSPVSRETITQIIDGLLSIKP